MQEFHDGLKCLFAFELVYRPRDIIIIIIINTISIM